MNRFHYQLSNHASWKTYSDIATLPDFLNVNKKTEIRDVMTYYSIAWHFLSKQLTSNAYI